MWTPGSDDVIEPRELDAQNVAIQKEDRGKRLVLSRCAHSRFGGETREELRDFGSAHLRRMALIVEDDEAAHPTDICLLGLCTPMPYLESPAHTIEETRLTGLRGRGFGGARRHRTQGESR